jgi:hypothetical protein
MSLSAQEFTRSLDCSLGVWLAGKIQAERQREVDLREALRKIEQLERQRAVALKTIAEVASLLGLPHPAPDKILQEVKALLSVSRSQPSTECH